MRRYGSTWIALLTWDRSQGTVVNGDTVGYYRDYLMR